MIYRLTLILNVLLGASACNTLFYHPDRMTYLTPDEHGFAYKESQITTADGQTLNYWVLAPKGEKLGTILHFHGNAQNISAHFLYVAWFTEFGYEVLSFDYRGYGKSTGSPTRQGLHTDAKAMLGLLESQESPYVIVAQSLGGAVAIPAIERLQPRWLRGLILDSTFASYRGIARKKLGQSPFTWALQWPLAFLVTDELSPIDSAASIAIPVLQFHSRGDHVVPYEEGEQLFARFEGEPQFVELPRPGHTTAFTLPFSDFHADLLLWLCDINPATKKCRHFVENKLAGYQ